MTSREIRLGVAAAVTTVAALGNVACEAAPAAPHEAIGVHIDDGALKNGATETATPAKQDCYSSVRGKLGRMLNNMGQLAASTIENGTTGNVKAHVHQYGSRFRVTLTDKTMPGVISHVTYPEGPYGQPLTSSPVEIDNTETQKGTGKQNTVILKLNPQTGEVEMDAVMEYDNYQQDPESFDATLSTEDTPCAVAEEKLPAGAPGTVIQDIQHLKYGSVFTSLRYFS